MSSTIDLKIPSSPDYPFAHRVESVNFDLMLIKQLDNILRKFESIQLEEMDNVQLMQRTDTKFAFTMDELLHLLSSLEKDYKVLEINGIVLPHYESLYFDDADLQFYQDHHNKKLNRAKIRFRKYVESDVIFLEIKQKVKGKTIKHRIPAAHISDEINPEQMDFIQNAGYDGKQLQAVLKNSFNRMTLVGKDEEERLTIDINLQYSRNEHNKKLNGIVIAELKQKKVNRNSPFYQLMKDYQLRPSGLSKYCIGVIKLFGKKNVKYNRFKKNLLTIKKIKPNVA